MNVRVCTTIKDEPTHFSVYGHPLLCPHINQYGKYLVCDRSALLTRHHNESTRMTSSTNTNLDEACEHAILDICLLTLFTHPTYLIHDLLAMLQPWHISAYLVMPFGDTVEVHVDYEQVRVTISDHDASSPVHGTQTSATTSAGGSPDPATTQNRQSIEVCMFVYRSTFHSFPTHIALQFGE